MSKLIIILVAIFLSAKSINAQILSPEQYSAKKSKRTHLLHAFAGMNQPNFKINTELNNGLESVTQQYFYNDSWTSSNRTLFTYDNSSNSYEELEQLYYFEAWLDFSKSEYTFTPEGYPLENTNYESSGISFQESSNTVYHYASDNKVDSVVFTETDEEVLYKDVTILNYITTDSIFIQENSYQDGVYVESYEGSIVYKDGNLVITYDDTRDTYFDLNFDDLIKDVTTFSRYQSYLYEEKNSSDEWEPVEKDIYEKENGKFISGAFYIYENNDWVLETKHNFNYEYNRLTSVVDSSFYNDYVDINRSLFEYTEAVSNENEELVTQNFYLHQNYPNPFNPITTIPYTLNNTQRVTLDVYNILGQKVVQLVNGIQSSGNHNVSFDASNLTTGIYVYRLQSGELSVSRKLLLIK